MASPLDELMHYGRKAITSDPVENAVLDFINCLKDTHFNWNNNPFFSNQKFIDRLESEVRLPNKKAGQEHNYCDILQTHCLAKAGIHIPGDAKYRVRALRDLAKKHGALVEFDPDNAKEFYYNTQRGDLLIVGRLLGASNKGINSTLLHIEGVTDKPLLNPLTVRTVSGNDLAPLYLVTENVKQLTPKAFEKLKEYFGDKELSTDMIGKDVSDILKDKRYFGGIVENTYGYSPSAAAKVAPREVYGRIDIRKLAKALGVQKKAELEHEPAPTKFASADVSPADTPDPGNAVRTAEVANNKGNGLA